MKYARWLLITAFSLCGLNTLILAAMALVFQVPMPGAPMWMRYLACTWILLALVWLTTDKILEEHFRLD